MLIHCAVVLCHVLVVAAPPAAASETDAAAEAKPPEAARNEQAKQLYAEQRYVESARAFEGLYGEFKAAKYLFNAAAAREAAGQDAHAYVSLRRYLAAPGLTPAERERGEARMGPLQRRTSAIRLEVAPSPFPAGIEITMIRAAGEALVLGEETLRALGDSGGVVEVWAEAGDWSVRAKAPGFRQVESPVRSVEGAAQPVALTLPADAGAIAEAPPPAAAGSVIVSIGNRHLPEALVLNLRRGHEVVEKQVYRAESTWRVPVGTWTLTAASSDFFAEPQSVEVVGDQPQHVGVPLQRTPNSRLKLGLTGAAASALGLVGIGFAIRGAMVFPKTSPSCEATAPTCPPGPYFTDLRDAAISRYVAGAALGTSLGLGAGALLMHRGERRRMTRVGLGVGVSLLVVGAVATGLLARSFADDALDDTRRRSDLDRLQHGTAAAVGLSGFGLGLVTSSLVFANFGKRGPRR